MFIWQLMCCLQYRCCVYEVLIIGCCEFEVYELWGIWSLGLWTSWYPWFWMYRSLEVVIWRLWALAYGSPFIWQLMWCLQYPAPVTSCRLPLPWRHRGSRFLVRGFPRLLTAAQCDVTVTSLRPQCPNLLCKVILTIPVLCLWGLDYWMLRVLSLWALEVTVLEFVILTHMQTWRHPSWNRRGTFFLIRNTVKVWLG